MSDLSTDKIIREYFNKKDILVKHQIESYNDYIINIIPCILSQFFPVSIDFNNENLCIRNIKLSYTNYTIGKPYYTENNGCSNLLYPSTARLRNYTYSLSIYIDIIIVISINDNNSTVILPNQIIKNVLLGKIPIMTKSKYCTHENDKDMCPFDLGGYLIINGNEKVIISQEKITPNKIQVFKDTKKYSYICEIRSYHEKLFNIPKLTSIRITNKFDKMLNKIYINVPILQKDIPLFVIFKIFGCLTDKEIIYHIIDNNGVYDGKFIDVLLPSFEDVFKIRTKLDAFEYLYPYLNQSYNYLSNENKNKYIENYVLRNILPHITDVSSKLMFLGYMVNKLIKCYLNIERIDDRDSYSNKRIDTPGVLLGNLTYLCISKMIKDIKQQMPKEVEKELYSLDKNNIQNIINESNINRLIKSNYLETCLKNSLATGNWGIKGGTSDKSGVSQVLNRLTYMSCLSHLRRISASADITGKLIPPRKLHNTCWGYICPSETPEGQSIGLVKNLAIMCEITSQYSSEPIRNLLKKNVITFDEIDIYKYNKMNTKIFINGDWIGFIPDVNNVVKYIKEKRSQGIINIYVSIHLDYSINVLYIYTDRGRCIRPLIKVYDNNIKNILKINNMKNYNWNNLCIDNTHSIIEYIDIHEVNNTLQCISFDKLKNKKYTHLEIDPSVILGILASSIPFAHHNQSPRNTYQSAMGKQSMGVYSTKFRYRFDTFSHILNYPQTPLITTKFQEYFNSNHLPNGTNVIVAIASYGGYNQEDSIIINRSSIERGLFTSTFYRSYKEEEKKNQLTGEEDKFCKPDSKNILLPKNCNYDKLESNGFIKENTFVNDNDIIIGRIKPTIGEYKHRDTSTTVKKNEEGYIDKVYIDFSGDGFKFGKVRIRSTRVPNIGDKFSSRHGQKGTVGMIYDECDMPFNKDGICPDIIMNPHAIPSRMTIAQLNECLLAKLCAITGNIGDGTTFTKMNYKNIETGLESNGYEKHCNEVLYSGKTGEQLKCNIFFGPTYYQKLKHMANDKVHARSTGPIVSITRQPSEGRASHGGLRFGEMERDCMISHGSANFLKERLMDVSDKFECYVCNKCGVLIIYSYIDNNFACKNCNNYVSFSKIYIPYSSKLLFQELQCMSIIPRYMIK